MNRDFVYGVLAGVGISSLGGGLYWLVKKMKKKSSNPYEAEKINNMYMAFHYTPEEEYLAHPTGPRTALDFPRRCAQLCIKHHQEGVLKRALDVGCAVGRATFELAQGYDEVVGIDYSNAFIQRCQELKMTGQSSYKLTTEGSLGEEKTAIVHPDIDRTRVLFMVGDGCNLPMELGQFGCVLAGNLICRLPDPIKFFKRLPTLVVPGGIVVITSPYTWLEEYTPKDKWIGGYKDQVGHEVRGFEMMKELMNDFELIEAVDMPFLIRETVRLHQWTVAHATVWRRNAA